MRKRKGERSIVEPIQSEGLKVPTSREVGQMVRDVIKMQREEAARRRRLGIPALEAPGLTPDTRDSLYCTVSRVRIINTGREREF